jgi:aminoglycoside phosphotransferase (APT) family kinase protein
VSEYVQPLIDPGIATLSEVLDPIALAKHLRVIVRAPWNGARVEEVQVRVLRHHVCRRCTLEIGIRTDKGWHFLIGKVYRKDRSHIFQAMQGIQQAGFGPQEEFSIPEPLAYLSPLRLLVYEKVEGQLADEVLKTGDEQSRAAAAERCARWLARFHAIAPKAGEVCYARDHLDSESMQRCSREIAKLGGPLADKAARLFQQLEDTVASLSPVEMRAGHGSFSAPQVVLAQGRTAAFDWDRYAVADPARDMGRFLGALRRRALGDFGSIKALDGAAEVFLKTYLAVGPPGAEKNLRFFEAAACLKWAKHDLSHQVPGWPEKTEAMLDEGLDVLERGAV